MASLNFEIASSESEKSPEALKPLLKCSGLMAFSHKFLMRPMMDYVCYAHHDIIVYLESPP